MMSEVAAARAETEVAARAAKQEVEKAQASADGKMKEYVDKFREQVRRLEGRHVSAAFLAVISACLAQHQELWGPKPCRYVLLSARASTANTIYSAPDRMPVEVA